MKTRKAILLFHLYCVITGVCFAQPFPLQCQAINGSDTNLMSIRTWDFISKKEVQVTIPDRFVTLEYDKKDSVSKFSSVELQNDDLGLFLCYRFDVSLSTGFNSFRKKKKRRSFPNINFRLMAGII